MGKVLTFKRKPRPLRKIYQPTAPYEVVREDHEDGSISYEVTDMRPDSYRIISIISEYDTKLAKYESEQIARGLNMLVQYGLETLPKQVFEDD